VEKEVSEGELQEAIVGCRRIVCRWREKVANFQ
jgi:hypothetical protein